MIKHELSIIGSFHINHNEDASVIFEIEENKTLIAVMDGCSMGIESHFASTLVAKLLRKIGKELSFLAFIEKTEKTNAEILKAVLRKLFAELNQIKNYLHLTTEELLSTLIIGIVDPSEHSAELLTIGDGLVCSNGKLVEYDQDNRPDYLAYHLEKDFAPWLANQKQQLCLSQLQDLSISTDGIFTFQNFDGKFYPEISESELVNYLLINQQWISQSQMLKKKVVALNNEFGLQPSDDLTIIRLKFDPNLD